MTEQHECEWELILGRSKADCKTEGCPKKLYLNQIETRLNEYETLKKATEALTQTVGFFAAVIKSGEAWTEACEKAYANILEGKDENERR